MRILRIGSTGEDVIQLQSTLSILNYNPGITDGIFGVKTASAVIQFQKDYGLVHDGIVGPITWGYLQRQSTAYKIYIIKPGDTFYKIARANNTSLSGLIAANPGLDPQRLRIGQAIQLYPIYLTDPSIRIIYPKDGAILPYGDIEIIWTPVLGATSYTVDVTDRDTALPYLRNYTANVPADKNSFILPKGHLIIGHRYEITVYILDPSTGYNVPKYMPKVNVTIDESPVKSPEILIPQDNTIVSKTNFVLQYVQPDIEGNIDRTLILTSATSSYSTTLKVNTDHPEIPEQLPSFWFDGVPSGEYKAVIVYENRTQSIKLKSEPIQVTLTE
ncbi:peptidoglycan-binding protein [Desulfosporosinus youngiae]|uniref:peptidoglycan-binding protein n=1 Tax=Desulfosporosinus youngiae TaxID=339862 RepID=UPI00145D8C79|nr:peptidoglycan-binding protein [Desulfosporosinus youngiae]